MLNKVRYKYKSNLPSFPKKNITITLNIKEIVVIRI